jgi:hypothetical protein
MSRRCKWCGREYDDSRSTASDRSRYCSGRCEAEAERSKAEMERLKAEKRAAGSSGSDSDSSGNGCLWALGIAVVCGGFLMQQCHDEREAKKKEKAKTEKEATSNAENVKLVSIEGHELWYLF